MRRPFRREWALPPHRHLEDQLKFLRGRDPELYLLIDSIQEEELAHLNNAEERFVGDPFWSRPLRRAMSRVTDGVIWLSTWANSSRMARELAAARD